MFVSTLNKILELTIDNMHKLTIEILEFKTRHNLTCRESKCYAMLENACTYLPQ